MRSNLDSRDNKVKGHLLGRAGDVADEPAAAQAVEQAQLEADIVRQAQRVTHLRVRAR